MAADSTLASVRDGRPEWTIRGLVAAHKLIALGLAAVIALMAAMFVAAAIGSKGGAITDATVCSQWGSTNWSRQNAYARQYGRDHPGAAWAQSPARVISAINFGCGQAFGEAVADTTTVVQAISGNF